MTNTGEGTFNSKFHLLLLLALFSLDFSIAFAIISFERFLFSILEAAPGRFKYSGSFSIAGMS